MSASPRRAFANRVASVERAPLSVISSVHADRSHIHFGVPLSRCTNCDCQTTTGRTLQRLDTAHILLVHLRRP